MDEHQRRLRIVRVEGVLARVRGHYLGLAPATGEWWAGLRALTHLEGELARLKVGQDSCGCDLCRAAADGSPPASANTKQPPGGTGGYPRPSGAEKTAPAASQGLSDEACRGRSLSGTPGPAPVAAADRGGKPPPQPAPERPVKGNKTPHRTPAQGGSPRKDLDLGMVKFLAAQGLGAKAIGARLGVSGMTVSRRLAEVHQGRLL